MTVQDESKWTYPNDDLHNRLMTAMKTVYPGFSNLMLLVSGPSVLLAWLKLRKRNLGPILDANGWAVNARAMINIPFGASLTAAARLPENAERSLVDPFAEKKSPWKLYLFLLLALGFLVYAWRTGMLGRWLGM